MVNISIAGYIKNSVFCSHSTLNAFRMILIIQTYCFPMQHLHANLLIETVVSARYELIHIYIYIYIMQINCTLGPLYRWGKGPRYRCKYVAEWTPELVWTLLKKEKSLALYGNEPRFLGRLAPSIVTVPIMLSRILDNNSVQFNGHLLSCRLNSTVACYKDTNKTKTPSK